MEVGCYSMDLYCELANFGPDDAWDSKGHRFVDFPHQFNGPSRSACVKQARKKGWKFKQTGEVICPKCNHQKSKRRELLWKNHKNF